MENYICINGNKTELTEEQLKQLGIELPNKCPFDRAKHCEQYYCITTYGRVGNANDVNDPMDRLAFEIANYCTDKEIMEQRALHETLNRLLWRYAMEHGGEGNFEIAHDGTGFIVQNAIYKYFGQTFASHEIAKNAIEEVVKPFMEAHPDFKW